MLAAWLANSNALFAVFFAVVAVILAVVAIP